MVTKNRWYWFVVIGIALATVYLGYLAWQRSAASEATDVAERAAEQHAFDQRSQRLRSTLDRLNKAVRLPPLPQVMDAGLASPFITATPCGTTQRRTLEDFDLRRGAAEPFFMATLCGGEHLLVVKLSQGAVRQDGSPVIISLVTVDGEVDAAAARGMERQFLLHSWEQYGPHPTLFETSRLSDFGFIVVGQLFKSLFQEQPCTSRLQYRTTSARGRERLAGFTSSWSVCRPEGGLER